MTIRERVKNLCKLKGVTLRQFERDLGFAGGYASKLDNITPNASRLKAIADYFDVSTEYILGGNEFENDSPFFDERLIPFFNLDDADKNEVCEYITFKLSNEKYKK